jgi:hypothetical protein
LEDVENNLKKMGVRCYRKIAGDMDVRKLILKEAKMLHGPQNHGRKRRRGKRRRKKEEEEEEGGGGRRRRRRRKKEEEKKTKK